MNLKTNPREPVANILIAKDFPAPPASNLSFKLIGPSELPGFDKVAAHFNSELTGASGDLSLLISKDGSRAPK